MRKRSEEKYCHKNISPSPHIHKPPLNVATTVNNRKPLLQRLCLFRYAFSLALPVWGTATAYADINIGVTTRDWRCRSGWLRAPVIEISFSYRSIKHQQKRPEKVLHAEEA